MSNTPPSNPSNPRLEAALYLLEDFLAREREKERRGHTIEKVIDRLDRIEDKTTILQRATETVVTNQIGQNLRSDRHAKKLRTLYLRLEGQNGDTTSIDSDGSNEPTTSPNLKVEELARAADVARDLKKKWEAAEDEKKREDIWWRHTWVKVTAAIMLAMFTASCSGAGSLAIWYITRGGAK